MKRLILSIAIAAGVLAAQTTHDYGGRLVEGGINNLGTIGGTNTYTVSPSPAVVALAQNVSYCGYFTNSNTGASTLNISGLGAVALVKVVSTALANGDIAATTSHCFVYNGTSLVIDHIDNAAGGSGTVTTTGSPSSGNMAKFSGATSVTSGDLTGDVTTSGTLAATIAANAVTSAKMAAVNTRRVCDMVVGDTSGSVLTDAQLGPQKRLCYIPAAATVVEMNVAADAGTPNVIVSRNHAGTITNIVSAALATAASGGIACSNTGGTTGIDAATTCGATLQNTSLAAGDYLGLVSGTAGGTAKLLTVHVVYVVN